MVINLRKLLHLPVYTESGKKLGKVFDIELGVEDHIVERYLVRPNFLSLRYLLIQKNLVKSINEDRMVVEDGVEKLGSTEFSSNVVLEE